MAEFTERENPVDTAPQPERPKKEFVCVVSVRFHGRGKSYYFDPAGKWPVEGQNVIVETARGVEIGCCTQKAHDVPASSIVPPLRPLVRLATAADERIDALNREREVRAMEICQQKIEARGLDMKLVDVEYNFEGTKIIFFFTSDGRVDFRELVKDLAAVFHTRIELRQIGVRDGAKMLGGLGICGRPFCCSTFLEEFQPVSIKMAKTQSLSLNPAKISGTCGRLMCCLKYEQEAYEYLLKTAPKADTPVDTPMGHGVVTEVNLLRQTAKVRLDDAGDAAPQTFPLRQMGYVIGGVYRPAEEVPEEEPTPGVDRFGFRSELGDLGSGRSRKSSRPAEGTKSGEKGEPSHRRSRHGGGKSAEKSGEKSEKTDKSEKHDRPEDGAPRPRRNNRRGRGGHHGGGKPASAQGESAKSAETKRPPQGEQAQNKPNAPAQTQGAQTQGTQGGQKSSSHRPRRRRGGQNHRPSTHSEGGGESNG